MRRVAFLLPVAALGLSCIEPAPASDTLLDEIENSLPMPKGARPLADYGRAYAREGDTVFAHLIVPIPAFLDDNAECEELAGDGESRPCEHGWRKNAEHTASRWVGAGERRWYADRQDLPMIFDGGCMMVSFQYDVPSESYSNVDCNGQV